MRTCTSMIYTNGKRSVYAVMRGKMIGRAFDAHSAEIIARVEREGCLPDFEQFYRETTAQYATKDAPPVYWQR